MFKAWSVHAISKPLIHWCQEELLSLSPELMEKGGFYSKLVNLQMEKVKGVVV